MMAEALTYFYQGQPVEVLSRRGKTWRVLQNGAETRIPSQDLEPTSPILEALWENSQESHAWACSFLTAASGTPKVHAEVLEIGDQVVLSFMQITHVPSPIKQEKLSLEEVEIKTSSVLDEVPQVPQDLQVPVRDWGRKRHAQIGVVTQKLATDRDRFTRGPSSVTTSRGHVANRLSNR